VNPGITSSPESVPDSPTSAHVPSSLRMSTVRVSGVMTQISFTLAERYSFTLVSMST
jgi:hypothetical protein